VIDDFLGLELIFSLADGDPAFQLNPLLLAVVDCLLSAGREALSREAEGNIASGYEHPCIGVGLLNIGANADGAWILPPRWAGDRKGQPYAYRPTHLPLAAQAPLVKVDPPRHFLPWLNHSSSQSSPGSLIPLLG
jgi:hypothetical protein